MDIPNQRVRSTARLGRTSCHDGERQTFLPRGNVGCQMHPDALTTRTAVVPARHSQAGDEFQRRDARQKAVGNRLRSHEVREAVDP